MFRKSNIEFQYFSNDWERENSFVVELVSIDFYDCHSEKIEFEQILSSIIQQKVLLIKRQKKIIESDNLISINHMDLNYTARIINVYFFCSNLI